VELKLQFEMFAENARCVCYVGEPGANVLAEALTPDNTKIKEFLVDLTLPMPIFEKIFRRGGGKAKGKGKKGKKK
jgi:hypothetical protein